MARKSDYIDGIWILAQSSASITHLFNLIKDFISEVNLKNFWLICNCLDFMILKFILEEFWIAIYIIKGLLDILVNIRWKLTVTLYSYVQALAYVRIFENLFLLGTLSYFRLFHISLVVIK